MMDAPRNVRDALFDVIVRVLPLSVLLTSTLYEPDVLAMN